MGNIPAGCNIRTTTVATALAYSTSVVAPMEEWRQRPNPCRHRCQLRLGGRSRPPRVARHHAPAGSNTACTCHNSCNNIAHPLGRRSVSRVCASIIRASREGFIGGATYSMLIGHSDIKSFIHGAPYGLTRLLHPKTLAKAQNFVLIRL